MKGLLNVYRQVKRFFRRRNASDEKGKKWQFIVLLWLQRFLLCY